MGGGFFLLSLENNMGYTSGIHYRYIYYTCKYMNQCARTGPRRTFFLVN